ncbi:MAG: hypothetical protein IAE87_13850 [Rhodobacteraceae bacterium]|jgi:hypothetical protein|nr:hypothetical protein [Paracoccaceae bacterium]
MNITEQICSAYSGLERELQTSAKDYAGRAETARGWYRFVVTVIVLALGAGLVAPAFALLGWDPTGGSLSAERIMAAGYVFIAVAGVAALAERSFTMTRNYRRKALLQVHIDHVARRVRGELARLQAFGAAPNFVVDVKAEIDAIRGYRETWIKLIDDETREWSSDVDLALEELNKKLAAKLDGPPAGTARPPAANGTGVVSVRLPPEAKAAKSVEVTVGSLTKTLTRSSGISEAVVIPKVPEGMRMVSVAATMDDNSLLRHEAQVEVHSGRTSETTM